MIKIIKFLARYIQIIVHNIFVMLLTSCFTIIETKLKNKPSWNGQGWVGFHLCFDVNVTLIYDYMDPFGKLFDFGEITKERLGRKLN